MGHHVRAGVRNDGDVRPSRAAILRSQYAHSHGVWTYRSPEGGFLRFEKLGYGRSNVAPWLDRSGYHTGYMGKYLNEYVDPILQNPQAPWRQRLLYEQRLGGHVYDDVRTDDDWVHVDYPPGRENRSTTTWPKIHTS